MKFIIENKEYTYNLEIMYKGIHDIYDLIYFEYKDIIREDFVCSSVSLFIDFINNKKEVNYDNKDLFLEDIITFAVVCLWLVDKFDSEDPEPLINLQMCTGISSKRLIEVESKILNVLNFRICKHMPGLTPTRKLLKKRTREEDTIVVT